MGELSPSFGNACVLDGYEINPYWDFGGRQISRMGRGVNNEITVCINTTNVPPYMKESPLRTLSSVEVCSATSAFSFPCSTCWYLSCPGSRSAPASATIVRATAASS